MTKTESANLTAQTVLIESAEQVLQLQMAEGVRLAIPNTNNLIMVGPQEWIAKNVPGVEAMVEGALTNERIIEIADTTKTAESRDGDYILPISFARAIEREVITRLAATTQASTAQGEQIDTAARVETPATAGWFAADDAVREAWKDGYAQGFELAKRALAATSSTDAQAATEVRDAALDAAIVAADDAYLLAQCSIERGEFNQPHRQTREAIENAIRALRAGGTGSAA